VRTAEYPFNKSRGSLTRTHVPIQQTSPPADQTADTLRRGTTADCAIFHWRAPDSQPLQSRRAARHPDMFEKYRTCDPCRSPQRNVYDVITRRVFPVGNENCSRQHTLTRPRPVRCSRFCVPNVTASAQGFGAKWFIGVSGLDHANFCHTYCARAHSHRNNSLHSDSRDFGRLLVRRQFLWYVSHKPTD
jgi:hypothetical protein